jgi:NADH:ubiquinone oxidoreductase subunit 5 (subunit L)/multisubunit Na+/H+ antiporter MnhA subunit
MMIASFFKTIDTVIVDGSITAMGKTALAGSRKMRQLQNGQIQHYAMFMVAGVIAIFVIVLFIK